MTNHPVSLDTSVIDPMRVAALHATLDLPGPPPGLGDALPPFWHWSQFWMIEPPGRLGRDGHPAMGLRLPEVGLPRRMWAGGALDFFGPIVIGQAATRRTTVTGPVKKSGRSGKLAFLTVTHEISCNEQLAVRERQDLVFREDPVPGAPVPSPEMAPTNETEARAFSVTSTDLFRYSALTFNGHRIHYDLEYCRDVEGYPGLVVHGPILAQRLIDLADDFLCGVTKFAFRARAPIFHFERFTACAREGENGLILWIRGEDGRLAMTAEAN